jgi:5-carboxymethyl-2-hydroxymuconate isomerase
MVHVVLKVAPGHSDEKKKRTCAVVFELLKAHFADTFERRYLLLSVELVEITAGDGPTLKANNLDRVLARPAGSGVT